MAESKEQQGYALGLLSKSVGSPNTAGTIEQKNLALAVSYVLCQEDKPIPFHMGKRDEFKWSLLMSSSKLEGFFSFLLRLDSSNKKTVLASFKFVLFNDERKVCNEKVKTCSFDEGKTYGFDDYIATSILFDKRRGLLPANKLTFACELTIFYDLVRVVRDIPPCNLTDELSNLLQDSKFSDVTFIASDGQEIKSHKNILAARSAVFSAMFEHGMVESQQSRVEVKDINHDVLLELFRYIYTGQTDFEKEMAGGLLAAADKYALERLKKICEEVLCKDLSTENVVATLILADRHNVVRLKKRAIEFINANSKSIVDTPNFLEMVKSYPLLTVDVFRGRSTEDAPSNKRIKLSVTNS